MNKRLLVYLFGRECTEIARYKDMLNQYDFVGAISPNGWGYKNKDTSYIDGGYLTNIIIDSEFNKFKNEFDILYVNDEKDYLLSEKNIQNIVEVLKNKKEVLTTERIARVIKQVYDSSLINIINESNCEHILKFKFKKLSHLNIPIITIYGLGNYTNKFATQLALRKFFVNKGYKVSQLGTKYYSRLFGFDALPNFLFSNSYSNEEKVNMFNLFVKDLADNEKPDIMIIGVPESIMPLFEGDNLNFGFVPFIISNAIKSDISILNLYYNLYTEEYFKELQLLMKYRLNTLINYFSISNTKLSKNIEDFSQIRADYTFLDIDFILPIIKTSSVFSAYDSDSFDRTSNKIINQLSENINIL